MSDRFVVVVKCVVEFVSVHESSVIKFTLAQFMNTLSVANLNLDWNANC